MSQLAEFISNNLLLSLAFISVFFLYIMIFINEKMQAFANVNTAQLTQLVNHQDAVVVDTRNADDFKKGHIVNAINIPLSDMSEDAVAVSKLKNKTVIAYCASGLSSKSACKTFIKSGVENVFNLTGGINAWIGEKLPVVK